MARNYTSMYQELWDEIKKDFALAKPEGVTIAAHKSRHSTIIKAIQTRKLKDTGAKFVWAEEGKGNIELSWDRNDIVGTIKFTLVKRNISEEDL